MNRKLEMVWWIGVALAAFGIALFWILSWNGYEAAAVKSITVAGICGYIALGAKGLKALRTYNGAFE